MPLYFSFCRQFRRHCNRYHTPYPLYFPHGNKTGNKRRDSPGTKAGNRRNKNAQIRIENAINERDKKLIENIRLLQEKHTETSKKPWYKFWN